jgi:hypothetical protein
LMMGRARLRRVLWETTTSDVEKEKLGTELAHGCVRTQNDLGV